MKNNPLKDPKDGHILTRAIIDTIQEPLIILDEKLRVIAASKSFYKKFGVKRASTQDQLFYNLGNGQWNIPALRKLLKNVIPSHTVVEQYKVEHTFHPPLKHRIMLINAREVRYQNGRKKMLLAIFDITEQEQLKSEREDLLLQKELLLKEMRHRIANSLQLIASILILKAGMVKSDETRRQLEDAHDRIMSIATVQKQLDPVTLGDKIDVNTYLTALCKSLAKSMIGSRKSITLTVRAGKGAVTTDEAISFGLVTTELVINALKHAFPNNRSGKIVVAYQANGPRWTLSVGDNGTGHSTKVKDQPGLGTGIVAALANQLKAKVQTMSTKLGTTVSVISSNKGIS